MKAEREAVAQRLEELITVHTHSEQIVLFNQAARLLREERVPMTSESAAAKELREMEQRKDDAYAERNKVVRALASQFPSGIRKTNIEGWSEDWHHCVYIDLPTGQVSWHYHDSQQAIFADLPPYEAPWDGHDTETKYQRLALLERTQPSSAVEHSSPQDKANSPQIMSAVVHPAGGEPEKARQCPHCKEEVEHELEHWHHDREIWLCREYPKP